MVKAYTKNPVGAGYGLGDWLLQRLTAIVMAFYTVALVAALVICKPSTHADWKAMFAGGFMRIATLLFLVALALFAYLAWSVAILWGR